MDGRQNANVLDRVSTIPRIERTVDPVAIKQTWARHLGLAGLWFGYLYAIGFFATPDPDAAASIVPMGLIETIATTVLFAALLGIFAVIGLALGNSKVTAPLSAICGTSLALVFASCALEGHPISAWGMNAGLSAGMVAASLFVMRRRNGSAA